MNSASRLLRIYDRLMNEGGDGSMVQLWTTVFELIPNGPNVEDEVTILLMALRSEVAFARSRLDAYDVPPGLTSPAFERLTQFSSPGLLHSNWHSHRGNLTGPEVRKALEWSAWLLRGEDEADMSTDELAELQTELGSLEQALGQTDMAPYLRDFIRKQIDGIRGALRMYRVQGVRPMQDALEKVAGAYKTQELVIEKALEAAPEEAKGVFSRTAAAVEKVAKVSDQLCKIKKAGEEFYAVGAAVTTMVIPYLPKLLNP